MICPKCKSVDNFETSRSYEWYVHFKCKKCGTVSFRNNHSDTPHEFLNWCGDPKKHWENGTGLEGAALPKIAAR